MRRDQGSCWTAYSTEDGPHHRVTRPQLSIVLEGCSPKGSQKVSPIPLFKSTNSWCSALFMVQLLHPYMTIGKTIAFIGKVMSLLFNILSTLVIAFLPSSKCLLISWLQSPSVVILEPKKIGCHCFIVSASICHEVMGPDAMVLVY